MTREQKIQQAFRLVEAIVNGYASKSGQASGLIMDAWAKLFKNCYEGVDAMLKKANEIDPPATPEVKVM